MIHAFGSIVQESGAHCVPGWFGQILLASLCAWPGPGDINIELSIDAPELTPTSDEIIGSSAAFNLLVGIR